MTLVFDTETTGKLDFKAPFNAPHQPRLVELAAILFGLSEEPLSQVSLIVKPEGFVIPEAVSAIHGITTGLANQIGVPVIIALATFNHLMRACVESVAFNYDFDEGVLRGEYLRAGKPHEFHEPPFRIQRRRSDAMLMAKDVCKLPGYYGDFKWPSLQEAWAHCFAEPFAQGHEALDDVRRTAKIFFEIRRREKTTLPKAAQPAIV